MRWDRAGGFGVSWRAILLAAVIGTLAACPIARAETPGSVARIGYLALVAPAAEDPIWNAFVRRLSELGWTAGRNVRFEPRYAHGIPDRFPGLARELTALNVAAIVVAGVSPGLAAKDASTTIPIILAGVSDPVGFGLVQSLPRPGGNITGLSDSPGREIEGKRLELLKELVPRLVRVAVILDSTARRDPAPIRAAARVLGIELLVSPETAEPDAFRATFRRFIEAGADAIYAPETPVNALHRDLVVSLAVEHRLPAMYGSREFVDAGGLVSYGTSRVHLYEQAATYVDRVLRGARPADLPVEQPTRFELALNLKTAAALRLAVPRTTLLRAEHVVR